MRLIDADAIPWTDLNDNPNSKIRVLVTFAEKVNKMPTIEERKTGKWIHWYEEIEDVIGTDYRPHCKCSECGTEYDPHIAKFMNFCSYCGADMRGEKDG